MREEDLVELLRDLSVRLVYIETRQSISLQARAMREATIMPHPVRSSKGRPCESKYRPATSEPMYVMTVCTEDIHLHQLDYRSSLIFEPLWGRLYNEGDLRDSGDRILLQLVFRIISL